MNPAESGHDRALQPRIPLAYHVLPKGYFYGWNVAVACGLLMMVAAGVGYYGLAVFLRPLQEEHGWSNSVVSLATSTYFVASGLAAALIGPHIDRRGPIGFMTAGVLLISGSAGLVGFITELWHLFALYLVLALGFGMASAVSINAIMTRWFVRRRAFAMSISATGISLGGVILTPLGSWLVEQGGLALATPILGAAVVLIPLPVVLFVIAFDPRQIGLLPDGDRSEEEAEEARRHRPQLSQESQLRIWTVGEALQTGAFWAVLVAFVLVLLAQTGFVIHQIAFLEDRLGSRSAAAFTLSTTAFGSIVARLVVGLFADAVDKRWLTVVLFVVQASSVLLILHVESTWATFVLTLVFGFTIGNVYMMQSLLVGEIFGMMSFGAVFGLIAMAGQTGSGLGPFLVGWLADQTGSYTSAFTVTAIITYAAAVAVLFVRPVPPPAGASVDVPEERSEAAGG